LAKPNYSFEKRQRELATKRKKEDKAAKKASGAGGDEMTPNDAAQSLGGDEAARPDGAAPDGTPDRPDA
jgi:hypothetical protein